MQYAIAFGDKVRAIDVRRDPASEGKEIVVFNPFGLAVRKPTCEMPSKARQTFVSVES